MKLGIISDTHDRLPLIDKAVERLNIEKAELILHAGDYIAPFVVSHFKPLKAKLTGIFGNNDAELELLRKKFEEIGAHVYGRFKELKIDGIKIAMLHGEEETLLKSLINTGAYDVIVYGHTHEVNTYKKGGTLVINPGEICGYLSGNATVAILDTGTLEVEIISL